MNAGSTFGVLGLGHDVVDVAGFAAQLSEPGSRMRNLFSIRELRQAAARARVKHDGEAVHLAARWAGKEAVLKAWCEALGERTNPYTLDNFPWAQVEILDDSRSRPRVVLTPDCEATLWKSLGLERAETMRADQMPQDENPVTFGESQQSVDELSSEEDLLAFGERLLHVSPSMLRWHVSLSHDGPIASAVVLLVGTDEQ